MNEKPKTPQAKTCGGVQKLVGKPAQGHSWRCGYIKLLKLDQPAEDRIQDGPALRF